MSHYTVGVVIKKDDMKNNDLESVLSRILEPFDENKSVAPYVSQTKEELEAEYDERVKAIETRTSDKYNMESLIARKNEGVYDTYGTYIDYYYGDDKFDLDGNLLSTYNPNSKWDWYDVGGRWSNAIKTKDEKGTDYAAIKDIVFKQEVSEAIHNEIKKQYEKYMSEGDGFYKAEYYKQKYPTLDSYVDEITTFTTYALLDSSGNWHEPGKMGWFGMSNSSFEDQTKFKNEYMDIINKEDPENILVVVDCHI